MVMNRVAKRKPRGDLRTWKEASEHAVHFEVSDPIQPLGPCQMNGPGPAMSCPPEIPRVCARPNFPMRRGEAFGGDRFKRCPLEHLCGPTAT